MGRRIRRVCGKDGKVIPLPATCTFKDLRLGQNFFLTPKGTTRVCWIKVCKWGAQYTDWNSDSSMPDQEFPADYPVFVL